MAIIMYIAVVSAFGGCCCTLQSIYSFGMNNIYTVHSRFPYWSPSVHEQCDALLFDLAVGFIALLLHHPSR